MEETGQKMTRQKLLISSFMNILKTVQKFYEICTNDSMVDLNEDEEKKKLLAKKCFGLNNDYIMEQLKRIKDNICSDNMKIYEDIKKEIDNIIDKYAI